MNRLFLLLFGVVSLVAHAQVPDYVPTQGLMAWLSFETADSSLTSFVATQGNFTSVSDRFGELSAARFTDQAIVLESETDSVPAGSFTFSFWTYHEGQEQFSTAVHPVWGQTFGNGSSHAGCGIWMHGTQLKVVEHSANYVRTAVDVADNFIGWHMITVVYQSNDMQVYKDGMLVAANTDNGRLIHAPLGRDEYGNYVDFGVGMGFNGNPSTPSVFQGVLDDFGVWNRALSELEIVEMIGFEIGCTDPDACNFDFGAVWDDGSCIPCDSGYIFCGNGTVWDNLEQSCIAVASEWTGNPCGEGTYWDDTTQECLPIETCQDDLDGDGVIGVNDLMQLLSSFGTDCTPAEEPETTEFTCGDPVNYHGYDYATVQIGEQCWFAENLRTELYQNGDSIPGGLSDEEWVSVNTGASAVYEDDSSNLEIFGSLYNWYATSDQRNLCPNEWHVPSLQECELLVEYLGGQSTAASMMKSTEFETPPWDGLNNSGFSAVPGGQRMESWGYFNIGSNGEHWTSSSPSPSTGYDMRLYTESDVVQFTSSDRHIGNSVRCMKD